MAKLKQPQPAPDPKTVLLVALRYETPSVKDSLWLPKGRQVRGVEWNFDAWIFEALDHKNVWIKCVSCEKPVTEEVVA